MRRQYVAKVTPTDDGRFRGEVVESSTGRPAGLSSTTRSATESASDTLRFTDALNGDNARGHG